MADRETKNLDKAQKLKSGDLYYGSVNIKSKKPDGFGVLTSQKSGGIHQGYFLDGKPHGNGILFHGKGPTSGGWQIGGWENGKATGNCNLTLANKTEYKGALKNSHKEGKGIEIMANGEKYDGSFKKDKREGWGTFTKKDGSTYEGQWKAGQRNGLGKVTDKKGTVKVTQFLKDGPGKKASDEDWQAAFDKAHEE